MKKGDLLVTFDIPAIKAEGYPCTTPMIVCNMDDYNEVKQLSGGSVRAGDDLLSVK